MDYIKAILIALVAGCFGAAMVVTFMHPAATVQPYGATNAYSTTITNPYTFTNPVTITATSTLNGASTVSYETKEGIDYAYAQSSLNSATTSSPAILRNPWFGTATATVERIHISVTSGVLGANTYDVATTTNCTGGNASSTPAFIYAHSVATGAQDNTYWHALSSTSPSVSKVLSINTGPTGDGSSPFFLAPSECLVMRVATSSPSTFTFWSGLFDAVFSKP